MPRSASRARVGSAVATIISAALVLGALAMMVAALGAGGADRVAERARGSSNAVYVGKAGCDDGRPAAAVRSPASPWCSLSRALRSAPSGSQVVVGPGRYSRLVADGRRQRLRPVAFRAQFGGARRPRLAGVALDGVDGVSFSGFLFTAGAEISRSTDVKLRDNGFESAGIGVKSSTGVAVVENRIRNLQGTARAFLALGSADASAPVENLVVRGNRFENIDHDAIAVFNTHRDVRIESNRISNVRQPPNFRYHSDAIQLMGGDDVIVRRNVIDDVTQGILVKDGDAATGLRIERNLVTDASGAGLQLFNAPRAVLDHNTIWGTRFGVIFDNLAIPPDRTSVTLSDNVVDSLQLRNGSQVRSGAGNVFGSGALFGRSPRSGTPEFVDPGRGDLRIRSTGGRPVPGAQLRVR